MDELSTRQVDIVPTPLLFQVTGIATRLAAIPLWLAKEHKS
jgi:hypothetical protein